MSIKRLMVTSLAALVAVPAAAWQWNLAEDFSVTKNRNGQWAYGSANAPGRFALMRKIGPLGTYTFDRGGAAAWQGTVGVGPEYYPFIAKIFGQPGTVVTMSDSLTGGGANVKQRAGGVVLHPGPNSEHAVVRWRAKATGTYHVAAIFYSCDANIGASTAVHVYKAGAPLFTGSVAGPASTSAWMSGNAGIYVGQGEHLDFIVGNGGNGFSYDSTCLDVTIRALDVRSPSEGPEIEPPT